MIEIDEKVPYELAKEEVQKWLTYKKVKPRLVKKSKDAIDALIESIQDGSLTLNDNFEFEQTLTFPIEGDGSNIDQLVYKPRVKVKDIHRSLKGIPTDESHEMIKAISALLIGQPKSILDALEPEDYGISQHIALFFIPR